MITKYYSQAEVDALKAKIKELEEEVFQRMQDLSNLQMRSVQLIDEASGKAVPDWAKGTVHLNAPQCTISTGRGEKQPDKVGPKPTVLETLIEKEGIDRQLFMEYLDSISWITDGMIPDLYIEKLLKPANWKAIMGAFGKWIDNKYTEEKPTRNGQLLKALMRWRKRGSRRI